MIRKKRTSHFSNDEESFSAPSAAEDEAGADSPDDAADSAESAGSGVREEEDEAEESMSVEALRIRSGAHP
jgi:hypothetical protein